MQSWGYSRNRLRETYTNMGIFDKLFGGGKKKDNFIRSAELMPGQQFWNKTFII